MPKKYLCGEERGYGGALCTLRKKNKPTERLEEKLPALSKTLSEIGYSNPYLVKL